MRKHSLEIDQKIILMSQNGTPRQQIAEELGVPLSKVKTVLSKVGRLFFYGRVREEDVGGSARGNGRVREEDVELRIGTKSTKRKRFEMTYSH